MSVCRTATLISVRIDSELPTHNIETDGYCFLRSARFQPAAAANIKYLMRTLIDCPTLNCNKEDEWNLKRLI